MINEFHITGPPGTGKTSYLSKQVERAVEKHGAENVIVASYTKAAATELNRRQLPIPRENIGTLHALCYRALCSQSRNIPEIAEVNAKSFNEEYPHYAITPNSQSGMDEMAVDASFSSEGDEFLNAYNLQRAKCLPLELMNENLIKWVKTWERWKTANNYVDFADMISLSLTFQDPLPGNPRVGIFDEVQDFNRQELNLIRHWSQFQDYILLAGDPDQSIYDFAGSDPEVFSGSPVPQSNKRLLKQSWRLPRKVHEYSQKWIRQIKNREDVEFNYKQGEEGSVSYLNATYKTPDAAIELAERYARDGKTVMLLTSCSYMLDQIKAQLRGAGLPFFNPYRAVRGDWNPLGNFHNKRAGRTSTRERLLSFLNTVDCGGKQYWSIEDLASWLELVKTRGILKKGAKEKIELIMDDIKGFYRETDDSFYQEIFEDFALEKALQRDLPWFMESLLAAKKKVAEYPLTVYRKHGRKALEEKPKIIVGTIHSTKGGEADCTILFPDLSLGAMEEYQRHRDSVIRTFYVGMTRAKESLILCKPRSSLSVKFN